MAEPLFVPFSERHDPGVPAEDAARQHHEVMRLRRSVRMFSDRPVSRETIELLVRTAGTAPSGTDLLGLLGQYDPQSPLNCTGGSCDFDNSGCVDVVDLLKLLAHYDPAGVGCP